MLRYAAWVRYPHWPAGGPPALPPPALAAPRELWTGAQLFSLLLPPRLTLARCRGDGAEARLPAADDLLIRGGQLLFGELNKATLGSSANGIVDVIYRDRGPQATVRFMSDAQRMVNQWLMQRSFSVGIADCVLGPAGHAKIDERLQNGFANIDAILRESVPESMAAEAESTVQRILSRLLVLTGDSVQTHGQHNNAVAHMVRSGSKGNPINLSQICGCVGQQSVEGQRIHAEHASRMLPCFRATDLTPNSNGFVKNLYALGLEPHEYFFHAMGGRKGLVDTAVKTATTGYIQRRQIKAMEDMRVAYDGTVRSAHNEVVQFVYGCDGDDPCRLEKQTLAALAQGEAAHRTALCDAQPTAVQRDELARFRRLLAELRVSATSPLRPALYATLLLPNNISRLIRNWDHRHGADAAVAAAAAVCSEVHVCARVDALLAAVQRSRRGASEGLCAALAFHMGSRRLRARGFTEASLDRICAHVLTRAASAEATPGEMVGAIAAQSLGEPATQMTLNTFHLSGVANVGMTTGVPRLRELLDFSKKIRTPTVTLRLRPPYRDRAEVTHHLAQSLPAVGLALAVTSLRVLHEPDPASTVVEADQLALHLDAYFSRIPAGASEWVARLTLDKACLRTCGVDPPRLAAIVRERLPGAVHVVSSQVNDVDWWLRCRFLCAHDMVQHGFGSGDGGDGGDGGDCGDCGGVEQSLVHRIMLMVMDQLHILGHPGLTSASASELDVWDAGAECHRKEWVVSARSCALDSLLFFPVVDWAQSSSNDVAEVLNLFGIEAAAALIFHELRNTISFDGTYVDPRHLLMVANTMTFRGFVMSISRHGMNRTNTDPLARCSFEETADVLYDAALFGEHDETRGVSQNIMTGQMCCVGTGSFDVLMPDWSLPSVGAVGERNAKLVKTTMRRCAPELSARRPEHTFGYVDLATWPRNTRLDADSEMPYHTEAPPPPPTTGPHVGAGIWYDAASEVHAQRRRPIECPPSPDDRLEVLARRTSLKETREVAMSTAT